MKKSIKQKTKTSSIAKNEETRPFTTKENGYSEKVFNSEEQKNYNKTENANNNQKNTPSSDA